MGAAIVAEMKADSENNKTSSFKKKFCHIFAGICFLVKGIVVYRQGSKWQAVCFTDSGDMTALSSSLCISTTKELAA